MLAFLRVVLWQSVLVVSIVTSFLDLRLPLWPQPSIKSHCLLHLHLYCYQSLSHFLLCVQMQKKSLNLSFSDCFSPYMIVLVANGLLPPPNKTIALPDVQAYAHAYFLSVRTILPFGFHIAIHPISLVTEKMPFQFYALQQNVTLSAWWLWSKWNVFSWPTHYRSVWGLYVVPRCNYIAYQWNELPGNLFNGHWTSNDQSESFDHGTLIGSQSFTSVLTRARCVELKNEFEVILAL